MSRTLDLVRRSREFLRRGIWELNEPEIPRGRRFFLRQFRFGILTAREFIADGCILRASALTYFTLLAIVPLFALTFALLTGLGVQNTLEPLLLERLTVGSEEIVEQLISYINNTNIGRVGVIGVITLLMTVIALMTNIEGTLNHLWGVKETRSPFRRFADYTSIMLLGPLFLFAAISMTSSLESQVLVQALLDRAFIGHLILFLFRVLPYVVMWAAFTALYIFMPNLKVRFQAALVGGIFGGTLWQLAQWGYVSSQVGVARYNAIYGTLAALPILMVWIYLSWIIVLLGAEVAYVWQNQAIIRREIREEKVNFLSQEMVALTILAAVADVFERGGRPWDMEKIASRLALPPRLTRIVLDELVQLGFLSHVRSEGDEEDRYQPGKPPEKVRVHDVILALRNNGASLRRQEKVTAWKSVWELERRLADAEDQALAGMTLRDLSEGKALPESG
ncbi:MAG: YihY family inner membrane protein [Desulfuromonadales bacterium]|nr:YihY family inner membrane protein [Desulfuromonadales bacterium]